jgi:hypothetical protein
MPHKTAMKKTTANNNAVMETMGIKRSGINELIIV